MDHANKCPRCKNFILGTYCYTCDIDIREIPDLPEEVKDLFGGIFGEGNA